MLGCDQVRRRGQCMPEWDKCSPFAGTSIDAARAPPVILDVVQHRFAVGSGRKWQRAVASIVFLATLLMSPASSSVAAAQDQILLLNMLQDGRDFRVRTQAAFALARKNDPSTVPALEYALKDKHPVVRAAAATALGRMASVRSLAVLRIAARDRESSVVEQARTAIELIERASASQTPTASAALAASKANSSALERARYAIVLGEMHNESGFSGPELARVLQASLARELASLRRVALFSIEDRAQLAEAEARGLPLIRLEGNVVQIMRELEGEQVSVHCEIALLLMDQSDRNLRSVLKGAATGIEPQTGPLAPQEKRLARKAVDGAVRSALRNASSAIENAAAAVDNLRVKDTATASLHAR